MAAAMRGINRGENRTLNEDAAGDGLNAETARLFAYHQATKHTYESVRSSAHFLDWKNQPNPFRTYEGAPTIVLPPDPGFPDTGTFATIAALAGAEKEHSRAPRIDCILLSRLLWHSMAVSAWKKVSRTGGRYSLRVNPSSGNLHPTETYLAVQNAVGLDDGLYHYRPDRHALELRSQGMWTSELSHASQIPAAAESPLIIALTSIFWREAWKYRDRAYRYCCHDLGHALMSLLLAAQALGLRGCAIAHFADCSMARTLGLAESDEAPMAFLVFPAPGARIQSMVQSPATLPLSPLGAFCGTPNELSPEEVPYDTLLEMHRATLLPDSAQGAREMANAAIYLESNFGEAALTDAAGASPSFRDASPGDAPSPDAQPGTPEVPCGDAIRVPDTSDTGVHEASSTEMGGVNLPAADADHRSSAETAGELLLFPDASLGTIVRQRRSALDFNPATASMPRAELEQLLDFATRDWRADWRGNSDGDSEQASLADFVSVYLYVHRVSGCEPGVYLWHRNSRTLEQLHRGNVERVAAYLSLEQALAGNACFAISMIADLAWAAQLFGNRGYRYVYFEAGAIGQRLYLGAEALHWNATGIGAFYDDDVHRYLGFLEEDEAEIPALRPRDSSTLSQAMLLPRQVIYHFAVGRAVPDPRLEG